MLKMQLGGGLISLLRAFLNIDNDVLFLVWILSEFHSLTTFGKKEFLNCSVRLLRRGIFAEDLVCI